MPDKTDDTQQKQLDELYALIERIETAMLTTRRTDGRLVSRPMATQERAPVADLWFVADIESDKMTELENDPNINLALPCLFRHRLLRMGVRQRQRADLDGPGNHPVALQTRLADVVR